MTISGNPWKQVVEEFEIRTVSIDNRITVEVRCAEGLDVKLDGDEIKEVEELLKYALAGIHRICYRALK